MLDNKVAFSYAQAWAKKVGADLTALSTAPDGGFCGLLGSLGFDYAADRRVLMVRSYLHTNSDHFTTVIEQDGFLDILNGVARQEPQSVADGIFEVCRPPWDPHAERSLFLRADFNDGSLPPSTVVSRLVKLREDAMVWRRTKLIQARDRFIKERRRTQGQTP